MKLLLVFAFVAAASAAQIRVQPLVLPEAPKPEVVAPETQVLDEVYDAVNIVEDAVPVDDNTLFSVKVVDAAELPEVVPIGFEMIDIRPLIVPEEVMRQIRETYGVNFVDSSVDAVRVVDIPVEAFVDAVRVVDSPVDAFVDAVRVVDAPAEQDRFVPLVPDVGFEMNVDPVHVVDGQVDAESAIAPEVPFENIQVDPVVIVNSVQNAMPLEYRRDLPLYDDPMLR